MIKIIFIIFFFSVLYIVKTLDYEKSNYIFALKILLIIIFYKILFE